jgi:hypothetical protein
MRILVYAEPQNQYVADRLMGCLADADHEPIALPRWNSKPDFAERGRELVRAIAEADLIICLPFRSPHNPGHAVQDTTTAVVGAAIALDKEVLLWDELAVNSRMHPSPLTWLERIWRGCGPLDERTVPHFVDLVDLIALKGDDLSQDRATATRQWHRVADQLIGRGLNLEVFLADARTQVDAAKALVASQALTLERVQLAGADHAEIWEEMREGLHNRGFLVPKGVGPRATVTHVLEGLDLAVSRMSKAEHDARAAHARADMADTAAIALHAAAAKVHDLAVLDADNLETLSEGVKIMHAVLGWNEPAEVDTLIQAWGIMSYQASQVEQLQAVIREQATKINAFVEATDATAERVTLLDSFETGTLAILRDMMIVSSGDASLTDAAALGMAVTLMRDLRLEVLRLEEAAREAASLPVAAALDLPLADQARRQAGANARQLLVDLDEYRHVATAPQSIVTANEAIRACRSLTVNRFSELLLEDDPTPALAH